MNSSSNPDGLPALSACQPPACQRVGGGLSAARPCPPPCRLDSEDKVALEIKKTRLLKDEHAAQLRAYLGMRINQLSDMNLHEHQPIFVLAFCCPKRYASGWSCD